MKISRWAWFMLVVSLGIAGPSLGATGVWRPASNGGRCLDAVSNTSVKVNTCTSGNAYQQWEGVLAASGGIYRQRNVARGMCLTTNGVGASLEGCSTTLLRQRWYVETGSYGGTYKRLRNVLYPKLCLDAGQTDLFFTCNTGGFQQWTR